MNLYIFIISVVNPRAPETRPKSAGAGAGAKMHPRVCSRADFFQSYKFACGRAFAKSAPAPAGAIPTPDSSLQPQGRKGSFTASTRCQQQQQTPPSMAPCLHHHVTSHASVLLLLLLSYPTALATEAKPLAGGWLDWLARYSQQQARVS